MMDCEGLSKIIGLIYEAGLKPDIWPSVLDRLADLLAATSGAAIISYDSRVRAAAMLFPRADPEYVRSFLEYWSHGSLMLDYGRRSPTAAVVNREMFISREEYCRTAFFNEWCKPLRAEAFMGAKLLTEGSLSTFFGVVRPYASGDFDQAETRLFAVLVPHGRNTESVALRHPVGRRTGPGHLRQPSCRKDIASRVRSPLRTRRSARRHSSRNAGVAPNHCALRQARRRVSPSRRVSPRLPGEPIAVECACRTPLLGVLVDRCCPAKVDRVRFRSRGLCRSEVRKPTGGFWLDPGGSRIGAGNLKGGWAGGGSQPARRLVGDRTYATRA